MIKILVYILKKTINKNMLEISETPETFIITIYSSRFKERYVDMSFTKKNSHLQWIEINCRDY